MHQQTTTLENRQNALQELKRYLDTLSSCAPAYRVSQHPSGMNITKKFRRYDIYLQLASCVFTIAFWAGSTFGTYFLLHTGFGLSEGSASTLAFLVYWISAFVAAYSAMHLYEVMKQRKISKFSQEYDLKLSANCLPSDSFTQDKYLGDLQDHQELLKKAVSHKPLQNRMSSLLTFIYQAAKAGDTELETYVASYQQILPQASMYELLTQDEQKCVNDDLLDLETRIGIPEQQLLQTS